jgi:polyhydroxyalkanoate synthesis regulator phasin
VTDTFDPSSESNALDEAATRFGAIAKALGLVTAEDIIAALRDQEDLDLDDRKPKRIGDILVAQGKLTTENVEEVLREQESVERASLSTTQEIEGFIKERQLSQPSADADVPTIEELNARVDDLERRFVTKERVEQIAASAALDVLKMYERDIREGVSAMRDFGRSLEKREFARKVAESLSTLVCRRALEEPVADVVHFEFEKAIDARAQHVFEEELRTPKVAKRVREIAGASREVESASRRLARRLDRIEQETLPQRLDRMFQERIDEKLGNVSAEAIAAKLDLRMLTGQVSEVARDAIGEMLFTGELQALLKDTLLQAAMNNLVNTDEFKKLLDEKFKTITKYLADDVIPKYINKIKQDE